MIEEYGFPIMYVGAYLVGRFVSFQKMWRVKNVVDGDTVDMARGWYVLERVRFFGVDAPESSQPFGAESTKGLKKLCRGRAFCIDRKGSHAGRIVGDLFYFSIWRLKWFSLGEELLRRGMAHHETKYAPKATHFAKAQRFAQKQKRGLWRVKNPTTPSEWRNRK
jgi:endonuclease YncB( thermonuclease family)